MSLRCRLGFSMFSLKKASNPRKVPRNNKVQEIHFYIFHYISILVTVDICRHDLGELVAELLVVRPGEGLLSQGPSP